MWVVWLWWVGEQPSHSSFPWWDLTSALMHFVRGRHHSCALQQTGLTPGGSSILSERTFYVQYVRVNQKLRSWLNGMFLYCIWHLLFILAFIYWDFRRYSTEAMVYNNTTLQSFHVLLGIGCRKYTRNFRSFPPELNFFLSCSNLALLNLRNLQTYFAKRFFSFFVRIHTILPASWQSFFRDI